MPSSSCSHPMQNVTKVGGSTVQNVAVGAINPRGFIFLTRSVQAGTLNDMSKALKWKRSWVLPPLFAQRRMFVMQKPQPVWVLSIWLYLRICTILEDIGSKNSGYEKLEIPCWSDLVLGRKMWVPGTTLYSRPQGSQK
ncbi:hypothetical protein MUK42_34675 [Musa troglodytarum]|uniref:Uncharacterized protein n=1 Tax=Musa troglodytarum TaxID=320322 RepID=A0A9E7J8V6_9LILI|nr:hypothetical protein MUK42_34675 [Musa troglodytarum]